MIGSKAWNSSTLAWLLQFHKFLKCSLLLWNWWSRIERLFLLRFSSLLFLPQKRGVIEGGKLAWNIPISRQWLNGHHRPGLLLHFILLLQLNEVSESFTMFTNVQSDLRESQLVVWWSVIGTVVRIIDWSVPNLFERIKHSSLLNSRCTYLLTLRRKNIWPLTE